MRVGLMLERGLRQAQAERMLFGLSIHNRPVTQTPLSLSLSKATRNRSPA